MSSPPALVLHGLLYLDPQESSSVNASFSDFSDRVRTYALNALGLSASLARQDVGFVLLTNNRAAIEQALGLSMPDLRVEEIAFTQNVPRGIRFYSAHFKLDVMRYLSRQDPMSYVGTCDLDMVCLEPLPEAMRKAAEERVAVYYDITDQVVPAYGTDVILADLDVLAPEITVARWAGGEFLAGPPEFFGQVIDEVDAMWPRYLAHLGQMRHVGEEPLVSAALNRLVNRGVALQDAGALGIVVRHWNSVTRHDQPPLNTTRPPFLLHLPADKDFLAAIASRWPEQDWTFLPAYQKWVRRPTNLARLSALRVRTLIRGH